MDLMARSSELPVQVLSEAAAKYAAASAADNTKRAYSSDWADFEAWCSRSGRQQLPAPPSTLADYIAELAVRGYRTSTINRRCAAISRAHRLAGYETPLDGIARETMAGIRRSHGTAPREVAPVTLKVLRLMLSHMPRDIRGERDRALLLLGFAGALRRSDLVGLDVTDLAECDEGIIVTIRRSKTDQEGEGRKVGIPYGSHRETCPVRSLLHWLDVAQLEDGPIFRPIDRHGTIGDTRLSDRSVALIVQRAAGHAGLDPKVFGGHSLRAGLATEAAAAGVSEHDIARTTGHKSVAVLRRYVRTATVFERNAAASVGL
jgi:site-specific recombinase XerD